MTRAPDLAAALAVLPEIEAACAAVTDYSFQDFNRTGAERVRTLRDLEALVTRRGGKVSHGGGRTEISLCGHRAGSTAGLQQAARNWIAGIHGLRNRFQLIARQGAD